MASRPKQAAGREAAGQENARAAPLRFGGGAHRPIPALLGRPHDEDRQVTVREHLLRLASDDQPANTAVTVRRHDNEIAIALFCGVEYRVEGMRSARGDRVALDAGLGRDVPDRREICLGALAIGGLEFVLRVAHHFGAVDGHMKRAHHINARHRCTVFLRKRHGHMDRLFRQH